MTINELKRQVEADMAREAAIVSAIENAPTLHDANAILEWESKSATPSEFERYREVYEARARKAWGIGA